ncbi:MAG: ATP-binding protein [bacterium]
MTKKTKKDRKFMEIAVNEMKYSRSQGRSKPDPMVGVVVVSKKGEKIFQNHRSYYNLGEHGEYTLLQKDLPNEDLIGCTIYVTLEPCIRRNNPKKSCSHWIVERGISRVVIGILDPNPNIYNKGVTYLKKYGIIVDFFDYDLVEEIKIYNREFLQYMKKQKENKEEEEEEKKDKEDKKNSKNKEDKGGDVDNYVRMEALSHEEERPISEATLDDLSKDAIQIYCKEQKHNFAIPSDKLWENFKQSKFVVERNRVYVPTLVGIVLFGRDPEKFITDHKISFIKFITNLRGERSLTKIESDECRKNIKGSILTMIKDTLDYYKKCIIKVPRLDETQTRQDKDYEYPPEVIREGIVNALVHRDYSLGGHISFEIFQDGIRISSPGLLPKPNTLEEVNAFRVKTVRRNSRIAHAVSLLGKMEKEGFGIPGMRDKLREYGLRPPEFSYEKGYLVVTLFGRKWSVSVSKIIEQYKNELLPRHIGILKDIEAKGKISNKDVVKKYKITRETASQDFRKLRKLSIIEKRGGGKHVYYVLWGS